jgi:hypothetical protein
METSFDMVIERNSDDFFETIHNHMDSKGSNDSATTQPHLSICLAE